MEEILASIRRIIADDDGAKAAAEGEPSRSLRGRRRCRLWRLRRAWPRHRLRRHPSRRRRRTTSTPCLAQLRAVHAAAPPQPPAPEEEPDADILDLTESMAALTPVARGFRTIDGAVGRRVRGDASRSRRPANCGTGAAALSRARRARAASRQRPRAAVDSAFNTLAQTVLVQNARTLEDLVREMLRPMLKTWLDDNLPGLVERLVRAEIERVSRGRN